MKRYDGRAKPIPKPRPVKNKMNKYKQIMLENNAPDEGNQKDNAVAGK